MDRDFLLDQYRSYCKYCIQQRSYIAKMGDVLQDDEDLIKHLHERLYTFKEWFNSFYPFDEYQKDWDDIAHIKFGPINI